MEFERFFNNLKNNMGINDFFSFSSKLLSSTYQVCAINLDKVENPDFEFAEHKLIQGIYDGILFPVVFQHYSGKKLCDVLDTGWASLYLISDSLRTKLLESKLVGWKTFPIQIVDKKGVEIKGYSGFSIVGRSGPIDYNKSKIIEKRLTSNAPLSKFYKGLYFDLETWDGSDFFLTEKNYGPIVTKRAAEILTRNKFTNIELRNLSEIEMDDYTVKANLKAIGK